MNEQENHAESRLLGKQVAYPSSYAPEILVAVPRHLNRTQYDIDDSNLPFSGFDVWHAYEMGFLTNSGLPVTGLLKIAYPANSQFIVESKSLKLYLNSFNMERFSTAAKDSINKVVSIVSKDLSELLKTEIKAEFYNHNTNQTPHPFDDYQVLEDNDSIEQIQFEQYTDTPSLLQTVDNNPCEIKIGTHLLRSNCKITHQPDWGSAFIRMQSNQTPKLSSILQYIVSLRNENHFHEEICEMLFMRLLDAFAPDKLMVACLYTRRGGIDICPVRTNYQNWLPQNLVSASQLTTKLLRQ